MNKEVFRGPSLGELSSRPEHKIFEGIDIQWGKGQWEFQHPEHGPIIKPTFQILNPSHWGQIADRLKDGETAAGMMMGNFGVFKKLDAPESADALFDRVKQRDRTQNFVALVHPDDMIDFIDTSRLQEPHNTELLLAKKRANLYAGPQHVILPAKQGINESLIRAGDQSIALFWVPDHFGFEGLVNTAKQKIGSGILGGGSLNIHGQDPHYDKNSLYKEMAQQPDWLDEIDFIIFDDIAEAGDIGRSHTMIRYLGEKPEVVRVGSLSIDHIRKITGHDIQLGEVVKEASSKTPYSEEHNTEANRRVMQVLERVERFNLSLREFSVR